jgi:Zn finger protein HypA/HybF involved in hydrogenase expression
MTAELVPAGSDVSAGSYRCSQCGTTVDARWIKHLPPCPSCGNGNWQTLSGGDSVDDAYPGRPS